MKTKRILALLLALAMLAGLAGCGEISPATTTESTEPPVDVGALYRDATVSLESAQKLSLEISDVKEIGVGEQVFKVDTDLTLNYATDENGAFLAEVSYDSDCGSYDVDAEEIYANGKVHAEIGDLLFSQEMTKEAFTGRYIPAVMLDPALYTTASASEDEKTLTFSDATAPESWLGLGAHVELVSTTAVVSLDAQGAVSTTTYQIRYLDGTAEINRKITARVCPPEEDPIEAPTNEDDYAQISFLDSIYTMEEAYGLALQAENTTSTSTETVISQALAVIRVTQNTVNAYGSGKEQMIRTKQELMQTDYTTGDVSSDSMVETYRDGKYTAVSNGGEPEERSDVDLKVMENHYQNLLLSTILDYDSLASFTEVTETDLGGITLYEFKNSEGFDAAARAAINYSFFEDETYIDKVASAYRADATGYYVAIDNATGLYTAAGMNYSGYHTVADTDYMLSMEINHSFDLASLSAYESITDQTAPDAEPEQKPTPLFYKVTGADGQQMWLLGTIHVGDDRTGHLPKELMDAFNSADALAVEIDMIEAEDSIENDAQLSSELSKLYFYTDGTTKDHIQDAELYAKAEQLIKASGNYNANTLVMKASLWENLLQNFYIQQGHKLSSEKGVDMRLLKLAKEQGKQIIEIESFLAQAKMNCSWSDPLQEMLLAATVESTMWENIETVHEMYALWCAGDLDALTEMIREDADTDDEDHELYEEYNKGLSTDRNALMLEAAKTYLESGETVFYAVGIAHLLAEDGLVYTLEDAGYTVEPVTFN